MNLIKEMNITVSGYVDVYRSAVMLQKLLQDAGVENVVIDANSGYEKERHDDEIKLFMGAKPDKITIRIQNYYIGG